MTIYLKNRIFPSLVNTNICKLWDEMNNEIITYAS